MATAQSPASKEFCDICFSHRAARILIGLSIVAVITFFFFAANPRAFPLTLPLYYFPPSLVPIFGAMSGFSRLQRSGFFSRTLLKQRSSDSVLRSIHSNRLLLFTLSAGLFFAGFGQFHWVYYGMTHGANLGFPSVSDVCYIVATLLITVGIYLAYEMNGYDFLDEIENNAFILSVASASTIVVVAAIHGGEFIEVIRQGKEHPLRYAFDLFYAILHVSNIVIVVRLFRKFPADRLSYGWQVFRNYFLATLSLLFLADVLRGFPFTIGNSLSLSSTNIAYALALLFLSLSVLFCPINDPLDAV